MTIRIQRQMVAIATVFLAAAVSGCASVATNIDSQQELGDVTEGTGTTLVFGKVQWINNGEELEVGKGMMSNTVELQMYSDVSDKRTIGRIGDGGHFAWKLNPGHYHIPAVNFIGPLFSGRGDFIGRTFLEFDVPEEPGPTYVGTLIIETEYKKKFLTWEAMTKTDVVNDCDSDCPGRLAELGLNETSPQVSLIRLDSRLSGLVSGTKD